MLPKEANFFDLKKLDIAVYRCVEILIEFSYKNSYAHNM